MVNFICIKGFVYVDRTQTPDRPTPSGARTLGNEAEPVRASSPRARGPKTQQKITGDERDVEQRAAIPNRGRARAEDGRSGLDHRAQKPDRPAPGRGQP